MASTVSKLVADFTLTGEGLYQNDGAWNYVNHVVNNNWFRRYTLGTGAYQANVFWNNGGNPILFAGAAQNYDLFGALTDAFNQTINLITLKEILIVNLSTNTAHSLSVGGNFLNAIGSGSQGPVVLAAGDDFGLSSPVNGYPITNTTAERVTLNPSAHQFMAAMAFLGVM